MDPSFQLALEVTNILNPLGQAVSALKSLGLIDAIKRSGSDALTELRLASFIGRHRIDEAIKIHFREAVAKSRQSTISKYIDIVLEAGAGPTVQEALKNPALFSMVIQLSALAFSHEEEPLANAMVEATERIARRSKRDADIVPDYVSLLGTVRACQQQTASFHWAPLYEAVERKILSALAKNEEGRLKSTNRNDGRNTSNPPKTKLDSVTNRRLPFKILESLLVGLLSLQSLEEDRVLHIKSDRGISTTVVWCHHVLGIGLSFRYGNVEVNFGNEPRNLIIEVSAAEDVCAIMMDPADPHEPLFTLHADDNDPIISLERRFQAFGFGSRVLMLADIGEEELRPASHKIIAYCLDLVKSSESSTSGEETSAGALISTYRMPSENTIMNVAKFLFALDSVDADLVEDFTHSPIESIEKSLILSGVNSLELVALVFVLSRIHPDDLDRCGNLPLSLRAFESLGPTHNWPRNSTKDDIGPITTIPQSFHILCHLMLGASFSEEYIKPAVLVSALGWSIFFGVIDALNPADASACDIRLLQGVPARNGLRRSRIIDGPTSLRPSTPGQTICEAPHVVHFPGLSTSKRGEVFVAHRFDAFIVTQSFEWIPEIPTSPIAIGREVASKRKQKMGFRKMIELCANAGRFPPCECDSNVCDPARYFESVFQPLGPQGHVENAQLVAEKHIFNLSLKWPAWRQSWTFGEESLSMPSLSEFQELVLERRVESTINPKDPSLSGSPGSWIFYVSENPAARWPQLACMDHSRVENLKVIIRGRSTCVECACKSPLLEGLGPTLVLL